MGPSPRVSSPEEFEVRGKRVNPVTRVRSESAAPGTHAGPYAGAVSQGEQLFRLPGHMKVHD